MGEVRMDRVWGYAQRVVDGDTFEIVVASKSRRNNFNYNQVERVRLASINAPELSQPGGRQARRSLERMLSGRRLQLDVRARDKYGRLIVDVRGAL